MKQFASMENKTLWKQKNLYDLGWGKENGYIRIPELTFEELWFLLCESKHQENKYGAASEIEQHYGEKLLNKLLLIVNDPIGRKQLDLEAIAKILKLNESINRSSIIGKSILQIEEDHKKWKYIKEVIETGL
jgi:hypothetical protein